MTLTEARVSIAGWRKEYDRLRPHSSGYRPPAPEAVMVKALTSKMDQIIGAGQTTRD